MTLVFKAPDGTNRVVALANDCIGVDTATCGGAPGVTSAVCRAEPGLATRLDVDLGDRRLVFPFPDTDADFAGAGRRPDARRSGRDRRDAEGRPAAVPARDRRRCAAQSGLLACIDELYANDGACGTTAPDDVFPRFTALPVAERLREPTASTSRRRAPRSRPRCAPRSTPTATCSCRSSGGGVLTRDQGLPVPRLIRFRTKSPLPFTVPEQVFLGSFTPEGGKLPPILEPQLDPTVADPDVFTALRLGRRAVRRRSASRAATAPASAATRDGSRCTRDLDCRGGTCARSCVDEPATLCPLGNECATGACGELFDLGALAPTAARSSSRAPRRSSASCRRTRTARAIPALCVGVGNACVSYALEAQSPVPLDGLVASDTMRTFAFRESIDGVDRNGDGDTTDTVVTLRDRTTGVVGALDATAGCGLTAGAEGRAVQRVSRPPFTLPGARGRGRRARLPRERVRAERRATRTATATPPTGSCASSGSGAGETALVRDRAVDGASKIDGRRSRSRAAASSSARRRPRTRRVGRQRASVADGGGEAAAGGDRRRALGERPLRRLRQRRHRPHRPRQRHERHARRLPARPRDRRHDPGERPDRRRRRGRRDVRSVPRRSRPTAASSRSPASSTNLLGPGARHQRRPRRVRARHGDARDRAHQRRLRRRRVGAARPTPDVAISDDGRFVAFVSDASDLLPPGEDTNGVDDVFVRDRLTGTTERVSVGDRRRSKATAASGVEREIGISGDGNVVVFASDARELLAGRDGHRTPTSTTARPESRSRWPSSTPAFGGGRAVGRPVARSRFSHDGRFVAFAAGGNVLPPGKDTNGVADVFVRDRVTGVVERVSVASDGSAGHGRRRLHRRSARPHAISADGRYVVFRSDMTNLVPGGDDAARHPTSTTASPGRRGADVARRHGPRRASSTCRHLRRRSHDRRSTPTPTNLLGPGGDGNGTFDVVVVRADPTDPARRRRAALRRRRARRRRARVDRRRDGHDHDALPGRRGVGRERQRGVPPSRVDDRHRELSRPAR